MDQTPMTPRGEDLLRKELQRLKTVERPRIVAAIAEARIKDIEGKLASANVIDVTKLKAPSGAHKVIFGATVTVLDVDTEKETTYKIVGEDEADIEANLISYKTPIAKGLLGKAEEDEIEIKIPKGTICYEIVKVEYI